MLVYKGALRGQGMGNVLNGLWVAHLFARRYNRSVCVDWPQFSAALAPVDGGRACRDAAAWTRQHPGNKAPHVRSWNFGASTPVAEMLATLSGPAPVVKFDANEWPDPVWPKEPMSPFLGAYRPTPALAERLPPGCRGADWLELGGPCGSDGVLHLRVGDNARDRRGVFSCRDPYGAIRSSFHIGSYTVIADHADVYRRLGVKRVAPKFHTSGLDSWVDWVAVATAKRRVFHTPSAFSESAVRVSPARDAGTLESGRLLGECDASRGVKVEAETFHPPNTRWHKE